MIVINSRYLLFFFFFSLGDRLCINQETSVLLPVNSCTIMRFCSDIYIYPYNIKAMSYSINKQ